MLSGFNTNIRHRGVLFHVQSEDSGRAHPHIITHLFHGGNIMFSEKSSYADEVEASDLEDRVRKKMEAQHKAVLKRLVANEFDEVIVERMGAGIFAEDAADTHAETRAGSGTAPAVDESGPGEPAVPEEASRSFGEGIVSDKPLDEVILNFLVENARKRRRTAG